MDTIDEFKVVKHDFEKKMLYLSLFSKPIIRICSSLWEYYPLLRFNEQTS